MPMMNVTIYDKEGFAIAHVSCKMTDDLPSDLIGKAVRAAIQTGWKHGIDPTQQSIKVEFK